MANPRKDFPVPKAEEWPQLLSKITSEEIVALGQELRRCLGGETIDTEKRLSLAEQKWAKGWQKGLGRVMDKVNPHTMKKRERKAWRAAVDIMHAGSIFVSPSAFRKAYSSGYRFYETQNLLWAPLCPVEILRAVWLLDAKGARVYGWDWPELKKIMANPAMRAKVLADKELGLEILQHLEPRAQRRAAGQLTGEVWSEFVVICLSNQWTGIPGALPFLKSISDLTLQSLTPQMIRPLLEWPEREVRVEALNIAGRLGQLRTKYAQGKRS